MIKAILFDVDNTLLSFDEYVKESMRSGFEKFGICTYEPEMFQVFTRVNNALWQSIEKGELDFAQLQKIRWNMIFERLGVSADGIGFEKYFRDCLFESAIVEDGAMELLEHLNGKYILCVASNGPYLQQVNRLKICRMLPYFSHLFISEEIGSSKPSAEFFNTCLVRLNAKAQEKVEFSEVMMIGDSLSSDIVGAIQCGMQTCFYNPQNVSVPSQIKLNYNLSSLGDIAKLI